MERPSSQNYFLLQKKNCSWASFHGTDRMPETESRWLPMAVYDKLTFFTVFLFITIVVVIVVHNRKCCQNSKPLLGRCQCTVSENEVTISTRKSLHFTANGFSICWFWWVQTPVQFFAVCGPKFIVVGRHFSLQRHFAVVDVFFDSGDICDQ